MSLTIWKFPLRMGEVSVSMPELATVLHVGKDPASDYPAIWALVDPDDEREVREFAVVGTGFEVPKGNYLGTFVEGLFVWHVFEYFREPA